MKSVILTTFFAILSQESQQNFIWKVVTSFNINPPLKFFFYSPILVNNNLLFKIYCENIVVTFLNCHFLFFILFFLSISSIRFFFFLHHTRIPTLPLFFFYFYLIPNHFLQFSLSLSLSLSFSSSLFFYLILEHSLALYVIRNRERTSKRYLACSITD